LDISGAQCKKIGEKRLILGVQYSCEKQGKKKKWVKRSSPKANDFFKTYSGGPGKTGVEMSKELTFQPSVLPEGSNLKVWVFDPENPQQSLGSPGIFIRKNNEEWKWQQGNLDGTVYSNLSEGEYQIDTVEPNRNFTKYERKRYLANVDSQGLVSILNLKPNSIGFFTLTIELKNQNSQRFDPQGPCQLEGQSGSKSLNNGFPRISDRLPTSGEIRALIIPVDFPDVIGNGNPKDSYFAMAKGMDDFYRRQSGGTLTFRFEILPNYLRLPFLSTKYNLGTWNAGDPGGYWQAVIAASDEYVDFSSFDAVYVLSPRSIPRSSIAYGPAHPFRFSSNDGPVKNGTHSGADAYQYLAGADWKWMAHETGHLFGLFDLYAEKPLPESFGNWDLMSMNWSTEAIELSAWNRYILGWLNEKNTNCIQVQDLSNSETRISLIPLVENQAGIRAQFIRLSSSKILVAELRTATGLDNILLSNQGVLVYTVDMTLGSMKSGWKVQRRNGSFRTDLTDAALKNGDQVEVEGVRIKVLELTNTSALISIAK
jgi:M6 family metalloprotease-like protein